MSEINFVSQAAEQGSQQVQQASQVSTHFWFSQDQEPFQVQQQRQQSVPTIAQSENNITNHPQESIPILDIADKVNLLIDSVIRGIQQQQLNQQELDKVKFDFNAIINKIYNQVILQQQKVLKINQNIRNLGITVHQEFVRVSKKMLEELQNSGYNRNSKIIEQIKENLPNFEEETKSDYQHFINLFGSNETCCSPGIKRSFTSKGFSRTEHNKKICIPCIKYFNIEDAIEFYYQFQEKDKAEQDQFIFGQLASFVQYSSRAKKNIFKYSFQGERCCQQFYKQILGKSNNYIYPRIDQFKSGDQSSVDKRGGAHHVVSQASFDFVLRFLNDFIRNYGQYHPGQKNKIILPSSVTKNYIFDVYIQAVNELNNENSDKMPSEGDQSTETLIIVSYSSFKQYIQKYHPNVQKSSPKTDYCDRCFGIQKNIQESETLEQKSKNQQLLAEHLTEIKRDREKYNENVIYSRVDFNIWEYDNRKKLESIVLSYDFAQNWLIPKYNIQPASLYFVSRQKVGIFGINYEGTNIQTNYLLREREMIHYQKGANLTLSLVYHYLTSIINLHSTSKLKIYFDNCGAQNKNNCTIQFYHWLVYIKKLVKEVEIYTMEVGHTKFSPDQHFGWMKNQYISADKVETFKDCIEICRKSSKKNKAVDLQENKVIVYAWDKYFEEIYDKCDSKLKIFDKHFYRFKENDQNIYYRYKYSDSEYCIKLYNLNRRTRNVLPDYHFVEKEFQNKRLGELQKVFNYLSKEKFQDFTEAVKEKVKGYE